MGQFDEPMLPMNPRTRLVAETDEWAPPEMINGLDEYLAGTGIKYQVEWYPDTHHGFVFPLRDGMYHKVSAERHWERLFSLFIRNGIQPGYALGS